MRSESEFSELWEEFLNAKDRFETLLLEAMGDFDRISHDPYDNSIEVDGVPPTTRLSEAAQRVIWSAGFRKAYVNHVDGWETHYSWGHFGEPFAVKLGWRRKAKPDGSGFLISFWPENWKKTEWLKSGYMVIEPDPLTPTP